MVAGVLRCRQEVQAVDGPDISVIISVNFLSSTSLDPYSPELGHLRCPAMRSQARGGRYFDFDGRTIYLTPRANAPGKVVHAS